MRILSSSSEVSKLGFSEGSRFIGGGYGFVFIRGVGRVFLR